MASTQAAPQTHASTGQPDTNTASFVEPDPQYLGLLHPSVLDGAYYVAVLQDYLQLARPPDAVPTSDQFEWGDIECLSISAGSFEWKTDWRSPSSDAARICMLRGRVSPKLLHALTSTFSLSPAFLVGHTGSDFSHYTPWPICSPLPSQRSNMCHVRFLSLGQFRLSTRNRMSRWNSMDSMDRWMERIEMIDSTSAACRCKGKSVGSAQKCLMMDHS